jgi:hypothetical protein
MLLRAPMKRTEDKKGVSTNLVPHPSQLETIPIGNAGTRVSRMCSAELDPCSGRGRYRLLAALWPNESAQMARAARHRILPEAHPEGK